MTYQYHGQMDQDLYVKDLEDEIMKLRRIIRSIKHYTGVTWEIDSDNIMHVHVPDRSAGDE